MSKPSYETRSGPHHPRWSNEKMIGSNGYVKLRVGRAHPLADPNGYAYEHLVVWVASGKPKPQRGWLIHHRNENKTDNRLENLELKEKAAHGIHHAARLTDAEVRAIREAYADQTADIMILADRFRTPHQTIWKLIRGVTRKEAGGPIQSGSLRGRRLLDGVEHNAFPEVA